MAVRRGVKMYRQGLAANQPEPAARVQGAMLGTPHVGGSRLAAFRVLPLPD